MVGDEADYYTPITSFTFEVQCKRCKGWYPATTLRYIELCPFCHPETVGWS